MAKGDHLIVRRGWYTHHAIDLGDGYVVQYGRGISDGVTASVHITSGERFSKGCSIEIHASATSFHADEIALRALNCVGEQEYHILWNNCEHFVNWCRTGTRESQQVDWFIENAGAAKLAVNASAKLSSKVASRAATTPWLIAADAAQLIAESTASALGREKNEAKRTGQAVGAGTSAGIGALTGGPVGAAVAVGVWAAGEVLNFALPAKARK